MSQTWLLSPVRSCALSLISSQMTYVPGQKDVFEAESSSGVWQPSAAVSSRKSDRLKRKQLL